MSYRSRLFVRALEQRNAPAVFTVMNTNDAGLGSLRQAVLDANALTGADSIVFDATAFATAKTISLTTGEILISDALFLDGPGATLVTVSGNFAGRVLKIDTPSSGTSISVDGITIANGKLTGTGINGHGANIRNEDESLFMSDCVVTNGIASRGGGGIHLGSAAASLTLIRCVISNNQSTDSMGDGAAINVTAPSTVFIDKCSISGNSATDRGGAVYFYNGGSLNATDSTFSSNRTQTGGGGVMRFQGTVGPSGLTFRNGTISGNTAGNGGGGLSLGSGFAGTLSIQNSTISGNIAVGIGGAVNVNGSGAIVVENSILYGDKSTSGGPELDTPGLATIHSSLIATFSGITTVSADSFTIANVGANPQISGLTSNGGPTQTQRLLPGSPAINAGANPANLAYDQRGVGFARNVNGGVDIGAYEVQAAPKVQSFKINDGSAQRSRITSLTVTFDGPVNLPVNPATAFELKRQSDSAMVSTSASLAGNSVTLTFTGGPVESGSLADGRYTLTALASLIGNADAQLDGDGNGVGGDNYVLASAAMPSAPTNIFRLFGDSDGDGTVAANDFIQLRLAFGGTNIAFDFDGDGSVSAADFIQFRLRFGGSI